MIKNVLECDNVCKKIGKKQIRDNITLSLKEKDILGVIGANGAGKTTIIKVLLGLQKMNSGTVKINGFNIKKDFEKSILNVGAIVETPEAYSHLTAYQNLKIIARQYKNIKKERILEVIKLVGLEHRVNDKVSKYSLGMKQRLGIAMAILNNPNLLILDEPTNGLDPEGIKDLRELIINLSQNNNMAILISSHNLAEIEKICNKICIIDHGKIVEEKNIKEIKKNSSDGLALEDFFVEKVGGNKID